LEVILSGGEEHSDPLIQYELPYTFDIVTKLPPRARNRAEDADAMDDVVLTPQRVLRTVPGHSSPVRHPASQSGPSGLAGLSSGDSGDPTNSLPPITSEFSTPPADNHGPSSPAEAPMPSRLSRHAAIAASDEEAMDEHDAVVERLHPSRGPMDGGQDIWISGSNFPTDTLYVRFGDNFASAVGVLYYTHRENN